jgi:hypothetical protein
VKMCGGGVDVQIHFPDQANSFPVLSFTLLHLYT